MFVSRIAAPPLLPKDEDFIRDITAIRFKINDRGFMEIERKESLKKRGFPSTDCADAAALLFAEEVPVSQENLMRLSPGQRGLAKAAGGYRARRQYDPLNYLTSDDRSTKSIFAASDLYE